MISRENYKKLKEELKSKLKSESTILGRLQILKSYWEVFIIPFVAISAIVGFIIASHFFFKTPTILLPPFDIQQMHQSDNRISLFTNASHNFIQDKSEKNLDAFKLARLVLTDFDLKREETHRDFKNALIIFKEAKVDVPPPAPPPPPAPVVEPLKPVPPPVPNVIFTVPLGESPPAVINEIKPVTQQITPTPPMPIAPSAQPVVIPPEPVEVKVTPPLPPPPPPKPVPVVSERVKAATAAYYVFNRNEDCSSARSFIAKYNLIRDYENKGGDVKNGYRQAITFIKNECTPKSPVAATPVKPPSYSSACRPVGGLNVKGLGYTTNSGNRILNVTSGVMFKDYEQAKNYANCSNQRLSTYCRTHNAYWVAQVCSPSACPP